MARLRAAGHKSTRARRTVLEVICASEDHLSSSEVLSRVHKREPGIGRASVFRTLETLTRLSIIRPTCLEARSPVYVLMPADGHHAHIICPSCHRLVEIPDCPLEPALGKIARRHNVEVTGHLLEIYGLCERCVPG